MSIKKEDKRMFVILVLGLLFMSFKKAPKGTVEVGDGDFGDFGTDGDFDQMASKVNPTVAPGAPPMQKMPISVPLKTNLGPTSKSGGCGCK